MSAIATYEDLPNYIDTRMLVELVNDTEQDISNEAALTSTIVQVALDTANGKIRSVIQQAGQYDMTNLEAQLSGPGLAYFKYLECKLAIAFLWERKPLFMSDVGRAKIDEAAQELDLLRRGVGVLGLDENINAGKPSAVHMPEPQVVNMQPNSLSGKLTGTYFPHR